MFSPAERHELVMLERAGAWELTYSLGACKFCVGTRSFRPAPG